MKKFKKLIIYLSFCICLIGYNSKAESQPPETANAYFYSGIEKSTLGKYEEAIDDFNKAIKIEPQYAKAYFYRGKAKAMLEGYEDDDDLKKASQINPQHKITYLQKSKPYPRLLMIPTSNP